MVKKSIDDLILKIERHKGVFVPSKKDYLDFVFEFSYHLLECGGISSPGESKYLVPTMREFIKSDAKYAKKQYHKHGGCYLQVAPVSEARSLAEWYYKKALK
jgi:hypothetical protein